MEKPCFRPGSSGLAGSPATASVAPNTQSLLPPSPGTALGAPAPRTLQTSAIQSGTLSLPPLWVRPLPSARPIEVSGLTAAWTGWLPHFTTSRVPGSLLTLHTLAGAAPCPREPTVGLVGISPHHIPLEMWHPLWPSGECRAPAVRGRDVRKGPWKERGKDRERKTVPEGGGGGRMEAAAGGWRRRREDGSCRGQVGCVCGEQISM
ncbi:uncharacterized protein ACOB8E_002831 isoform 4-T4 [Sarcophilus harrisii]